MIPTNRGRERAQAQIKADWEKGDRNIWNDPFASVSSLMWTQGPWLPVQREGLTLNELVSGELTQSPNPAVG